MIEFPRISAPPHDLTVASRDPECGRDDGFITSDTCFISPISVVMFVSNGTRTRMPAVGKSVTVSLQRRVHGLIHVAYQNSVATGQVGY